MLVTFPSGQSRYEMKRYSLLPSGNVSTTLEYPIWVPSLGRRSLYEPRNTLMFSFGGVLLVYDRPYLGIGARFPEE